MKIYLAGGMHTQWREKVISECFLGAFMTAPDGVKIPIEDNDVQWYNPMQNGGGELQEFVTWDLLAIKKCDVVFAYMEADNPYGHGMCAEIGYAKGLGKTVVFVNESEIRHIDFAYQMADVKFGNLADGIEYLQKLILLQ